jgi:hypothetical protein
MRTDRCCFACRGIVVGGGTLLAAAGADAATVNGVSLNGIPINGVSLNAMING